MNRYCVYKHTNLINNKVYIGQTCQKPEYRWGSKGQNYKSGHFRSAIDKYGWNNFSHEILYDDLTSEEANRLETELIIKYNSDNPEYGYNLDKGGNSKVPNQEVRDRMSQSAQNRPIVSEETKKKLSEVSLGRTRTEEQKAKYSLAAKKRETEKIAPREIKVMCLNTGEIFPSLRSAADWCGLAGVSGISSVCKHGKQKTAGVHPITKEKLKWEYVNE